MTNPNTILKAAKQHLMTTQTTLTPTGADAEDLLLSGALTVEGKFPAFQFDPVRLVVYPVVQQVNQLLRADIDPWGAWSWWAGSNGRLPDGTAPKDLLGAPEGETVLLKIAGALGEDGF